MKLEDIKIGMKVKLLSKHGLIDNYNNILDLTVYQIMNTFKLYQTKEVYKTNMDYRTSGNFKIEEEISHWFFKKN